jgi:hypothetical protein
LQKGQSILQGFERLGLFTRAAYLLRSWVSIAALLHIGSMMVPVLAMAHAHNVRRSVFPLGEMRASAAVDPDGGGDDFGWKVVVEVRGWLGSWQHTLPNFAQLDNARQIKSR